jgi:site-specific DNA-methyltransferase (adenine-specific)
MDTLKTDVLYYGDNLDILRKYIPSDSIDLIYLDPPFSSKKDYNIIFKEPTGELSQAQIKAFGDSWHWDRAAEDTYQEIILHGPPKVAKLISAMCEGIGRNDVMAYLVMMTIRLIELRRVLKDTGSLYLHCDPTASHYLKLVLDQIFSVRNFRSEVVWRRTYAHNDPKRYGRIHDTILFYAKSEKHVWNVQFTSHDPGYVERNFRYVDNQGRRYRLNELTARKPGGDVEYEWKGVRPPKGRYWAYSRANMEEFDRKGLIVYSKSGFPRIKQYLDESLGVTLQDFWHDIDYPRGKERLGYETQKPLALLERIIKASSNEGDVVLDPFCGCGTAVIAAQKLNRRWIGIDITHLAITVMRNRLQGSFPGIEFEVIGEPKDFAGACALAQQDRYQFQWWALSLIGAQPLSGERKKGADTGIDGIIYFMDDHGDKAKRAVVQVKSGHVSVKDIKELETVASKDAFGIFITLTPPTRPMREEAVAAGYYHSMLWNKDYPRIQILTIEELLQGRKVEMPPTSIAFLPKAPRISKKEGEQMAMEEPEIRK